MIVETFRDKCPDCGHVVAVRGVDGHRYHLDACPGCGKAWDVAPGHVSGWGGSVAVIGFGKHRGRPLPAAILER
jgi:rRNA maturation protein Nop10